MKILENKKLGFTLAEGTRWAGNNSTNKRVAFTLAEVLITLGIIGIVAAITIPTLVKNYQKMVWTNQLKNTYAKLQQGFKMILADEGVDLLSETEAFQSIGWGDLGGSNRRCLASEAGNYFGDLKCAPFFRHFAEYFKISNTLVLSENDHYKISMLNGPRIRDNGCINTTNGYYVQGAVFFLDGTIMFSYNFNPSADRGRGLAPGWVGWFVIDINGLKGPNQFGRDIFQFGIRDNGILYPNGSNDFLVYYYGPVSSGQQRDWKNNGDNGCLLGNWNSYGCGCAARVLEEGKMNY